MTLSRVKACDILEGSAKRHVFEGVLLRRTRQRSKEATESSKDLFEPLCMEVIFAEAQSLIRDGGWKNNQMIRDYWFGSQ